ncbi:MAG: hypothetical protein KAZ63_01825 [Vitreoscilla sp.]|nr:hypothetical protein [Vitreoscilla sp.]
MLASLLIGLEISEADPLAHYVAYQRRKRVRRGELDHMHVLFDPVAAAAIEEVIVRVEGAGSCEECFKYLLPKGYGCFLTETNGGLFYGGNVQIFGLRDNYDVPENHVVRYRPLDIGLYNTLARNSLLRPSDVHLGHYFYNQQMLVFDSSTKTLELTEPFSRNVEKSWGTFFDYFQELVEYRQYFTAKKGGVSGGRGPFGN